jgi:RNA polymerase sigma-70 factor (ECF subfamily)
MSWVRDKLGRGAEAKEPAEDARLVDGLLEGDESVFAELVDRYGPPMLRVASIHVRGRATAEEVVQETWLAVLNGIDGFEGRSSLKTWIFRILVNRAKTRAQREGRSMPFSALAARDAEGDEPVVDPDRFAGPEDRYPGHWAAPPRDWPQESLLQREALDVIRSAIEELPEAQRQVIRLRDVEGWRAEEVVAALEISDGNQRVLLHRARSRVRRQLEGYLNPDLSGAKT